MSEPGGAESQKNVLSAGLGGGFDEGLLASGIVVMVLARSAADRQYLRSLLPAGVTVVDHATPGALGQVLPAVCPDVVVLARTDAREGLLAAADWRTGTSRTSCPSYFVAESDSHADVSLLLKAGADDLLLAGDPAELTVRRLTAICDRAAERRRDGLLKGFVGFSPSPAFVADAGKPGYPLVLANPAFERLTGSRTGSLLGLGCELLAGRGTDLRTAEAIRLALWKGEDCEGVVQLPGGPTVSRSCELRLRAVRRGSGAVTHWMGALVDVSEKMRTTVSMVKTDELEALLATRTRELAEARHTLDTRRQFIETVLDSLSAGVLAADSSGVVALANRSALRLLELRGDECVGVPVRTVFRGADLLEGAMRDAVLGERRLEFEHETPSGRKLEIGLGVTLIGAAPRLGQISGVFRLSEGTPQPLAISTQMRYVFVFRDLGVQRQFEMEMRRVEGLSALGQMATAIAHEIRNPLAAISSLVETLQADLPEDDEKREYVARILSLLSRIEKIVRTSLRFARPKLPTPQGCHAADLIDETLEILQPRLGSRGMPRVALLEGLPEVEVDPDQIVEVLVALLENALDAATQPPAVEIRASVAEPDSSPGGRFVKIELLDDGPGIPSEIAPRVFDPFFTTKARGTGLGLSIAQRLIKDNRGHLQVLPRQGRGTCIRVLLPAAQIKTT